MLLFVNFSFHLQWELKSHLISLSFCKKCSKLSTAAKKKKKRSSVKSSALSILYDYKAMNRSSFLLFTWPKPILFGKLVTGHFTKQHIRRIFHIFESLDDWPSWWYKMLFLVKYENCAFAKGHWCKDLVHRFQIWFSSFVIAVKYVFLH